MKMRIDPKDNGQALVEFALIFTALFLLTLLILDVGRAIYYYSVVYNAAREGARFGAISTCIDDCRVPTFDPDEIRKAVKSKAVGLEISDADITISPHACAQYSTTIAPDPDNCVADPVGDPVPKYYYLVVTVNSSFTPVTPMVADLMGGPLNIDSTTLMKIEK